MEWMTDIILKADLEGAAVVVEEEGAVGMVVTVTLAGVTAMEVTVTEIGGKL